MSSHPKCPVCGGVDYTKESGFYFCIECNTQSQEVFEEVVDNEITTYSFSTVVAGSTTGSQKSTDEKCDYTSWESYNFILKGLVDQLVSLGASEDFKTVVLQLWVSYLKRCQAAFYSKDPSAVPKLGLRVYKRDAEIIYQHQARKKRRRKAPESGDNCSMSGGEESQSYVESEPGSSKSVDGSVSTETFKNKAQRAKFRKLKKSLMKTEYESYQYESLKNLADEMLRELSEDSMFTRSEKSISSVAPLATVESEVKTKKVLSKPAYKSLKKRYKKNTATNLTELKNVKKEFFQGTQPWVISGSRILAILYLGLLLSKSPIYLGDLLRWIAEDHLSYNNPSRFFPTDYRGMSFNLSKSVTSHHQMRLVTFSVSRFVSVFYIPVPDMLSMVERYAQELQLPADIINYTKALVMQNPPTMKRQGSLRLIANYEARAIAFIVVTLKLFFGLDGKTENKTSNVAAKLNELQCSETPAFVWNDWVSYVNCRKSILSMYNFRIRDKHFRDSYIGSELFINHLTKKQSGEDLNPPADKLPDDLIHALSWPLNKLENTEEFIKEPNVNFSPSVTPYSSYLENLKCHFKSSRKIPDLLKRDFTTTNIEYLIKPKKYVELAMKEGVKIKLSKRSRQRKFKTVSLNIDYNKTKLIKVNLKGTVKRKDVTKIFKSLKSRKVSKSTDDLLESDSSEEENVDNERSENESLDYDSREENDVNEPNMKQVIENDDNNKNTFRASNKIGSCWSSASQISSSQCNCGFTKPKNDSNIFKLHIPYTSYWMLEISNYEYPSVEFEREILEKLPVSFRWLISECADLIEVSEQDVYKEVSLIETLYAHIVPFSSESKPTSSEDDALMNRVKRWW